MLCKTTTINSLKIIMSLGINTKHLLHSSTLKRTWFFLHHMETYHCSIHCVSSRHAHIWASISPSTKNSSRYRRSSSFNQVICKSYSEATTTSSSTTFRSPMPSVSGISYTKHESPSSSLSMKLSSSSVSIDSALSYKTPWHELQAGVHLNPHRVVESGFFSHPNIGPRYPDRSGCPLWRHS